MTYSQPGHQPPNQQPNQQPPVGYYYPPPPPRPSHVPKLPWWGWTLLAVGVLAAIGALGSNAVSNSTSGNVTYTISGAGEADSITYSTGQGQEQQSNQSLPWSISVNTGSTASIGAQQGNGGYSITCTITEGTKVISTQTSNGQYAVVNCAART